MRPSDSLASVGLGSGCPLPSAYLRADARFSRGHWPGQDAPAPAKRVLSGTDCRLPVVPVSTWRSEGLPGCWVVLFIRAAATYPAGAPPSCPAFECVAVAFREKHPLGIRKANHFVAESPRPTCSRAYASPTSLPPSSQGSLSTRWATPWPNGFRTRWTTYRISWLPHVSTPFGPALPGRTLFRLPPRAGSPQKRRPGMPGSSARTAFQANEPEKRLTQGAGP